MKTSLISTIAVLSLGALGKAVSGFSIRIRTSSHSTSSKSKIKMHGSIRNIHPDETSNKSKYTTTMQRRTLISNLCAASFGLLLSAPIIANAESMPSVTSAEFDTILKDSAKSILSVELSGPKSETAVIKLVDGTIFTISDLVESSTDPRSPLKLVARCRLYKIPVKNTGLASALSGEGSIISSSGKKKKNYMNPRVQEAERKEGEKRERMAQDERERLEELYLMEGKVEGFLKE